MARRFLVAAVLTSLVGAVTVLGGASPAAAETSPWYGTVTSVNTGVNDPPPNVIEDSSSITTIDGVTRWDYRMTWTPIADQASSTDPFNTTIQAVAKGSISYREESVLDFQYKAPLSGAYRCTTVTTVTWSGTVSGTGPILPNVIQVVGNPDGLGGFATNVYATMSFADGVTTTTTRTAEGDLGSVCPTGITSTAGPWHDSVTVPFTSAQQPVTLQATTDVPCHSYLQFDDSTTATVNLARNPYQATLRGTYVGGIELQDLAGNVSITQTSSVTDATGNPVAVAEVCATGLWTFTTRARLGVPTNEDVPNFNGVPVAPAGANWDVTNRTIDKKGNMTTTVATADCAYGTSSVTGHILWNISGPHLSSYTYQPYATALTSAGRYTLAVGREVKGKAPSAKAVSGAKSMIIQAP